ncbi:MAG: MBL fold metallo-hydrolase [Amphiplicatus sp.]
MRQWKIGAATVTKIVESEMTLGPDFVMPRATAAAVKRIPWLKPPFVTDDGELVMSFHALVIETPDRRIVVDTCVGNDKPRPAIPAWDNLQGPFLRDLEAAGFKRESIDTVLCTHLHMDHVGWNTMLDGGEWTPTFPKARYLMAEKEFEHWRAQDEDSMHQAVFEDSVRPVFDAGLVDLIPLEHEICAEVRLLPTLGHTPGHVSVLIQSKGEQALITGDFVHHPCQMAHVDWSTAVDFDPEASIKTRRSVFEHFAETPTLIIGAHFAGPTAGRLRRDGDAYRLEV